MNPVHSLSLVMLRPVNHLYTHINRNLLQKCLSLSSVHSTDLQVRYASGNTNNTNTRQPRGGWRRDKRDGPKSRARVKSLSRADLIDPNSTDWASVYDAAASYNPSVIPLPIRMGRPRPNKLGDIPPNHQGNIELLKIPNFFHLTPPAIKKHCEALKEYCTPWPEDIGVPPIRVTTINFLYAGPSIRHPDSRKVKLQVYLKDLKLDEHARKKLILLVGDRYNPSNDELTLITDSCPTRKQNKDYAYYLLTALYHESWKTEPWEAEAEGKTLEELQREVAEVNAELNPETTKLKPKRKHRIAGNKIVRYTKTGHPFVLELNQHGVTGGLTKEEMEEAKNEWKIMQHDQPDNTTFDPLYRKSTESEFIN